MKYVEMPIEEAIKRCKKNTTVLVCEQDLEKDDNPNLDFIIKKGGDYKELFKNIETVASIYDDFLTQLHLFTEKQDVRNIRPYGIKRVVLLRE